MIAKLRFAPHFGLAALTCVPPQMGFPGSSSGVGDRIQEGVFRVCLSDDFIKCPDTHDIIHMDFWHICHNLI